jgi:hypothetical protein
MEEQLVAPGEVASRPLLPSVRYHPARGELSDTDMAFSPAGEQAVIGQAARVLSAKTQVSRCLCGTVRIY